MLWPRSRWASAWSGGPHACLGHHRLAWANGSAINRLARHRRAGLSGNSGARRSWRRGHCRSGRAQLGHQVRTRWHHWPRGGLSYQRPPDGERHGTTSCGRGRRSARSGNCCRPGSPSNYGSGRHSGHRRARTGKTGCFRRRGWKWLARTGENLSWPRRHRWSRQRFHRGCSWASRRNHCGRRRGRRSRRRSWAFRPRHGGSPGGYRRVDRPARGHRRPDGRGGSRRRLHFFDSRLAGCFGGGLIVPGRLKVCVRGRRCRRWFQRGFHGFGWRRASLGGFVLHPGFRRRVETVQTTQLYRHVFIDRAGVRLLFRYAEFGQPVQDLVSLDFQFPCQLIDANLLHRRKTICFYRYCRRSGGTSLLQAPWQPYSPLSAGAPSSGSVPSGP